MLVLMYLFSRGKTRICGDIAEYRHWTSLEVFLPSLRRCLGMIISGDSFVETAPRPCCVTALSWLWQVAPGSETAKSSHQSGRGAEARRLRPREGLRYPCAKVRFCLRFVFFRLLLAHFCAAHCPFLLITSWCYFYKLLYHGCRRLRLNGVSPLPSTCGDVLCFCHARY